MPWTGQAGGSEAGFLKISGEILPVFSQKLLLTWRHRRQELRAIIKMHRIIVVPITTPDKAMPFKNPNYF
jgi:hypothetical protein